MNCKIPINTQNITGLTPLNCIVHNILYEDYRAMPLDFNAISAGHTIFVAKTIRRYPGYAIGFR